MDLKKIFNNNKAVSPVIGVVLMVAITVILPAAIGSSVWGEGSSSVPPQANLRLEAAGIDSSSMGTIKIEHLGGDPINCDVTTTTIIISINGLDSEQVSPDSPEALGTLNEGDVKILDLMDNSATPAIIPIASGDTVYVRFIDVKTNQLICDTNMRF